MKANNVAMSGRIIPEPLTIPVPIASRPPNLKRFESPFGVVSVVIIAAAAWAQWLGLSAW